MNTSRLQEGGSDKGKGNKSMNCHIKYVCPEYGAITRAAKEVNVVCGDCDVSFERER